MYTYETLSRRSPTRADPTNCALQAYCDTNFWGDEDMLGTSGSLKLGNSNVDPESVVMTETIILNLHCAKPCLTQCKLNTHLAETNLHSVGPARFERRHTQCKSVHGCLCRATQNSMCAHLEEEDLRTNLFFIRTDESNTTRK